MMRAASRPEPVSRQMRAPALTLPIMASRVMSKVVSRVMSKVLTPKGVTPKLLTPDSSLVSWSWSRRMFSAGTVVGTTSQRSDAATRSRLSRSEDATHTHTHTKRDPMRMIRHPPPPPPPPPGCRQGCSSVFSLSLARAGLRERPWGGARAYLCTRHPPRGGQARDEPLQSGCGGSKHWRGEAFFFLFFEVGVQNIGEVRRFFVFFLEVGVQNIGEVRRFVIFRGGGSERWRGEECVFSFFRGEEFSMATITPPSPFPTPDLLYPPTHAHPTHPPTHTRPTHPPYPPRTTPTCPPTPPRTSQNCRMSRSSQLPYE